MRALQPVPVGERSILPGRTTTAFGPLSSAPSRASGPANWQNEMWSQPRGLGMGEAELLVRRRRDPHAGLGEVARFVRRNDEAGRRRVDDDEAVAAIGDVDRKRAQAFDLERLVEPVGERGHVLDR